MRFSESVSLWQGEKACLHAFCQHVALPVVSICRKGENTLMFWGFVSSWWAFSISLCDHSIVLALDVLFVDR